MARRGKDVDWNVYDKSGNTDWDKVSIIVMMDIRDELKNLNRIFECTNFLEIPHTLRQIRRNTAKPRKPKE